MLANPHRTTVGAPSARRGLGRPRREAPDRRALRLAAAVLCLGLALYCLIVATATLHAQTTAPGEPSATKLSEPERHRLPLLIPILFLVFVVVLAAAVRRGRRRASPPDPRPGDSAVETVPRRDTALRR
ncbi:MAG: hypothetical protein ACREMB_19580 [Candidatus Rokuibacteriota bacterium]